MTTIRKGLRFIPIDLGLCQTAYRHACAMRAQWFCDLAA
jgi:hypothetical protein